MRSLIVAEPTAQTDSRLSVAKRIALFQCGYLGLSFALILLFPDFDRSMFHHVLARWPRNGEPVFGSYFATWDAAHYLYLSEVGYAKDVPSCAFYPLWPLLMRWGSILTGGSHLLSGMILANLLSATAFALFYELVRGRSGAERAWQALLWLWVFPGSLFYHFVYSEALFFCLLMIFCLGLDRSRPGWVWSAGFLLPLTRPIGVLCLAPLAWHLGVSSPPEWLAKSAFGRAFLLRFGRRWIGGGERGAESPRLSCFLLIGPLLGWLLYFALMTVWTGNPWEGFEAQKYWGVHSINHLWEIPRFVIGWFTPTTLHAFNGSMLDRLMFLVLVFTAPRIWRMGTDLILWTYVLGVVPAMSGTFVSFTRFESVVFPVFIALAELFGGAKEKRVARSAWAAMAALQLVLLWRFMNFRWAG